MLSGVTEYADGFESKRSLNICSFSARVMDRLLPGNFTINGGFMMPVKGFGTDKKSVYMEIFTLENIYCFGMALKDFFCRVYRDLIIPAGLSADVISKPFYRKQLRRPMNREDWASVCRQLITGQIEELSLVNKSFPVGTGDRNTSVIAALRCPTGFPYYAQGVSLSIRSDLISEDIGVFQGKLLEIALNTFRTLGGVSGYITTDRTDIWPEQDPGPDYLKASWNLRNKFSGNFWGNLLSAEHIKELGGIERIKREAPVYRVKDIGTGDSQGVFLQLTPMMNMFSSKQMERLRDYLNPVLPVRRNPASFNAGEWGLITNWNPPIEK